MPSTLYDHSKISVLFLGNTARKAFADKVNFAAITGVDVELIHRLHVLLCAINTSLPVDPEKYRQYASETSQLYVELYSWYPMPPTLHKMLVHGADVMARFTLPLGCFSEECSEGRNKYLKEAREHHASKYSRERNLGDISNYLFATGDPLISYLSITAQTKKKAKKSYPSELLNMLLPIECSLTGQPTDETPSEIMQDDDDDDDDERLQNFDDVDVQSDSETEAQNA